MVHSLMTIWRTSFFLLLSVPILALIISSAYIFSQGSVMDGPHTDGVVLNGLLASIDMAERRVRLRWHVGGSGKEFAAPRYDIPKNHNVPTSLPVLPLGIAADIYFDKQLVMSYDSSQVVNVSDYSSHTVFFTTEHDLDGIYGTSADALTPYFGAWDGPTLWIGVRIVDPETNRTLPASYLGCVGSAFSGWRATSSWYPVKVVNADGSLAGQYDGLYMLQLSFRIDSWRLVCELIIGIIVVAMSFTIFVGTAWHIVEVMADPTKRSELGDRIAAPLALIAFIAAHRAAFPPNLTTEEFVDLTMYYPAFLMSLWSTVVAVTFQSAFALRIFEYIRRRNSREDQGILNGRSNPVQY